LNTHLMLPVVFSLAVLAAFPLAASAQQQVIFMPLVEDTKMPTIDGTWTSSTEWDRASETVHNYTDGTSLVIKAMRDADFVYVLLEMPRDFIVDGHAAICFDTLSDGGPYMNPDDICYVRGETLREYHGDGRTTLMQQAPRSPNVIAERGLSGSNSPYSSDRDHVTYEFRLDADYIGSERIYHGFYVSFDTVKEGTNFTYFYSWPETGSPEYLRVASPRAWGVLTTSESEIPEFPVPVLGALAGVIGIIAVATRTRIFKIR